MSDNFGRRSLRFRVSGQLKRAVLGFYGIAYSPYGLEPGLLPFLPRRTPATLIDIGAAAGDVTAAVGDHCGIRAALLIEPQPVRCEELRARFQDSRFAIRQCAAWDSSGTTNFDILNFNSGSSVLPVLPEVGGMGERLDLGVRERVAVPLQPLDTLVNETGLAGPIDLLKIDTQGSELHVLRGARTVLPRVRLIWIELSFRALYEGSALFPEVYALLAQHGFRLHSIQNGFRGRDGELLQADGLFLADSLRPDGQL